MPILPKSPKQRVYLRRKSLRMGNYAIGSCIAICGLMCYQVLMNRQQLQEMNSSDQVWSKINQPIVYNRIYFQRYIKSIFNKNNDNNNQISSNNDDPIGNSEKQQNIKSVNNNNLKKQ